MSVASEQSSRRHDLPKAGRRRAWSACGVRMRRTRARGHVRNVCGERGRRDAAPRLLGRECFWKWDGKVRMCAWATVELRCFPSERVACARATALRVVCCFVACRCGRAAPTSNPPLCACGLPADLLFLVSCGALSSLSWMRLISCCVF
jgi:hypothetical protein